MPKRQHASDLTFAYIAERDMDLLFVEELRCSHEFMQLFLSSVPDGVKSFRSMHVAKHDVWHSMHYNPKMRNKGKGPGESDIIVSVTMQVPEQAKIMLLIENKVGAGFQRDQGARYRERARLMSLLDCDLAYTILIASEKYLQEGDAKTIKMFDATVSYESMLAYFHARAAAAIDEETRRRFKHKAELLEQGIAKSRRGYFPHINRDATSFWADYYHLCRDYPVLKLKVPDPKPGASTIIIFERCEPHRNLPKSTIKHKLNKGLVDLEFAGWAAYESKVTASLSRMIDEGMRVRKAGKSLAVSISVPTGDILIPFSEQEEGVRAGLEQAARLQKWYSANIAALQSLAERVRKL